MQFIDLIAQHKPLKEEIHAALDELLDTGQFILGAKVKECEEWLAKLHAVKHAVGVNSCTDALYLSFRALDIGSADEVIVPTYTIMPSIEGIYLCGARPVLVDVRQDTYNIDPTLIEEKITSQTKAILAVHTYGLPCDMAAILSIAESHNLKVLSDAAQAIGAKYNGVPVCSLGDVSCLSFFPTKNLSALGDGGMLLTNNTALANTARVLRVHGSEKKYYNTLLGINSRLDAFQAAVLMIKLKHLKAWTKARQAHAQRYDKALQAIGDIVLPHVPSNAEHVYHQYVIQTTQRDALRDHLSSRDIPTMSYYTSALHELPVNKQLGYTPEDFPVSAQLTKEVLALPIAPELTKSKQETIINTIKEFYL